MDRVTFVQLELDRMNFVVASVRNGGGRDKMASRVPLATLAVL